MKHPHRLPSPRHYPDLDHAHDLERLGEEITELAAHIHAATCQLLEMIRIFDEEQGWGGFGVNSCALWLNWKCGMNTGAAREKVRVAHALAELPLITSAFREGRVSYSKVRAMTRVATRDNEDFLLSIARHGTANHVERLVSLYRRTKRNEALERVAETSRRMACDASVVHWHETQDGEPLSVGRKTRSIPLAIRRALQRRDGGCRFPGCTCSRFVDAHHITHWADGGETGMDNLVLLCRRHHRMVHEGGSGDHA